MAETKNLFAWLNASPQSPRDEFQNEASEDNTTSMPCNADISTTTMPGLSRLTTLPPAVARFASRNSTEYCLEVGQEADRIPVAQPNDEGVFLYCYHCDCPHHSHTQCPLRHCKACDKYGHSSSTCVSEKMNQNWRARPADGRPRSPVFFARRSFSTQPTMASSSSSSFVSQPTFVPKRGHHHPPKQIDEMESRPAKGAIAKPKGDIWVTHGRWKGGKLLAPAAKIGTRVLQK